jgi:predicted nucleic acid-binding protein
MLRALFERIDEGTHMLVASDALRAENDQNVNVDRKREVQDILNGAADWISTDDEIVSRRKDLTLFGFRLFDAYHVAMAEAGECDRLVTCDDQFLKVAQRHADQLAVKVVDPVNLVSEVDF